YRLGEGVTKNDNEAFKWYEVSSSKQNSFSIAYTFPEIAWANLGLMYKNGISVPQNYNEALKWFEKSANSKNTLGQLNLASMYHNGLGVQKDL
ncbi:tetratricopeptide repeat protein, partial [Aliarcobacter butzleri]|uniref:tetratricopeptide repeat protein n=1 Tax=Aliarcobacter butzleri TaxID=28197 RepID=UPI003AF75F11